MHDFDPTRRMRLKRTLRRCVARVFTYSGLAACWYHLVAKRGVRILAYHGIETPARSPFSVTVDSFDSQMKLLSKEFNVLSFDKYCQYIEEEKNIPEKSVIVTFDDGFEDFHRNALPILEKYRVPATCFVISSKATSGDATYMNSDHVKQVAQSGQVTVGSHSLSHRSIARIDDSEKKREIVHSKQYFEELLGKPIDYFCYPYGTYNDFDAKSVGVIKGAGYRLACTSINGVNFRETDPYRLRRTKVEWGDDPKTFDRMMRGGMDPWFFIDFLLRYFQKKHLVRFD